VGRPNLQSSAAVLAGVNLHGVAMRDAWGREYADLLGRRHRCFWTEERAIFELLTSATGVRVPWWLITREAFFSGRRLGGAYLRLRDPRPFTSMVGHWCRRAARRLFRRPAPRLSDAAAD
jgi:hypothetical protein